MAIHHGPHPTRGCCKRASNGPLVTIRGAIFRCCAVLHVSVGAVSIYLLWRTAVGHYCWYDGRVGVWVTTNQRYDECATFQKYKISFLNDEINERLDGRSGISCQFIPSHICSCAQNFLSGPTQKGRELVLMLISWISATMQGNPKKICTCLIQIYPFVRTLF